MTNLYKTRKERIMFNYLQLIYNLSIGYDGYENDIEGLKRLIDIIRHYAKLGTNADDKEVIYVNGNGKEENILQELI